VSARCAFPGLLAVLLCTGCANYYSYRTGANAPAALTVREWRHFPAWGLGEPQRFDVEAACAGRELIEFGSYVSVLNWLPTALTIGFYAPATVYAVCAAKPER
jgi:hypothetical protein